MSCAGKDMEPATPIHMLLQRLLGLPAPHYHHHGLILDADGRKLSKSQATARRWRLCGRKALRRQQIRSQLGFA